MNKGNSDKANLSTENTESPEKKLKNKKTK
jgi:hypothetical protein